MPRFAKPPDRAHAILLAAGLGRRMGMGGSKGFVSILGRPLLWWSLEPFARHPEIASLVVVHSREAGAAERCLREVVEPLGIAERTAIVPGGERRQDSSLRGILALPPSVREDPGALALIHDAARPLVSTYLISHTIRALREHPDAMGILPALPIRETIKRVREGRVESTLDREGLWAAQTPQGFRIGALLRSHRAAQEQGLEVTDDAALLEATGETARVIPGDPENLKVTFPEDRILVERLMKKREAR